MENERRTHDLPDFKVGRISFLYRAWTLKGKYDEGFYFLSSTGMNFVRNLMPTFPFIPCNLLEFCLEIILNKLFLLT
jgi:hypothetical protein